MLQITKEFKEKVIEALLHVRKNYDGSDAMFAKQWGINGSVFSRLKNGETDGLLKDMQWLSIGREFSINMNERKWNMARTDVFREMEEDILFCKAYSKGMMRVDDCGIGKTYSAKYLSRTLKNCFYIDASQGKGVVQLVKMVAKAIGVDTSGKIADIKANIKYYLKMLHQPIVLIDETGDLNEAEYLIIKEFWNGTEGACGWYLIGAEGFKKVMDKGMAGKRPGFREVFSRFSEKYSKTVPNGKDDKMSFYRKLITDVLTVNMEDKSKLNEIVKRCLVTDETGNIGGLRRAESLLILNS